MNNKIKCNIYIQHMLENVDNNTFSFVAYICTERKKLTFEKGLSFCLFSKNKALERRYKKHAERPLTPPIICNLHVVCS